MDYNLNRGKLKSYVDAMRNASEVITRESPDYVVAPMNGSIPFIDAMAIVDRNFDPSKVVYMPASSKFHKVHSVMVDWYLNFLDDVVRSPDKFPRVLGIDEVVSGSSVARCFKSIDEATDKKRRRIKQDILRKVGSDKMEVAVEGLKEADLLMDQDHSYELGKMQNSLTSGEYKKNPTLAKFDFKVVSGLVTETLDSLLTYRTIGIEDSKKSDKEKTYEFLRVAGRVIPVPVESILGMDDSRFGTPVFERVSCTRTGRSMYSPRVIGFDVTSAYVTFLQELARYVGVNPANVAPVNMSAILDSSKYLSSENQ